MTGTWIYCFPTFRYLHDRIWDAEAELENNRLRVERILQDTKWYAKGREKTAYLPNGIHQILYIRYAGLTWYGNPYGVSAHATHIALEIPVMTPGTEKIAAEWEKLLGIPADPVCTQIQLTEEEKACPIVLPDFAIPPEWQPEQQDECPNGYTPDTSAGMVSLEAAAEQVPAVRNYTVQARNHRMQLTRREKNHVLMIWLDIWPYRPVDLNLFEEQWVPVFVCEITVNGVGFTRILANRCVPYTDQQGLEDFLMCAVDLAEGIREKLWKEGVTAPDLPEWYR